MMKKSLLNLVMRFWTKINLFFAFSSTSSRNLWCSLKLHVFKYLGLWKMNDGFLQWHSWRTSWGIASLVIWTCALEFLHNNSTQLAISLLKIPSPNGRTQRPDIALMFNGKWSIYWGNLNFFSRSPFYWGIFLSIPSFAHKKLVGMHLLFDFVKTHMSNDCIDWFSALKYILKSHTSLRNGLRDFYLVFLELSGVMWMLESLEFGV
jgi:hypothetical protein